MIAHGDILIYLANPMGFFGGENLVVSPSYCPGCF